MKSATFLVVGAGDRGRKYSVYAETFPEKMKIVGVAEPIDFYRNQMQETYSIPVDNIFCDWKAAAAKPKMADAVIISTQDNMHTEPALAFAKLGYHILLEKPMAPTEAECREIVKTAKENEVMFSVCHVLRYTSYTQKLKQLLVDGAIGEIISMQHLEPVGYWHQAHSFVRGNWRNQTESTFMLLAKSCHDLDWISYIMGVKCRSVSSFGSLRHFRADQKPDGASDRCMSCPEAVENNCPYSAKRLYFKYLDMGYTGWPLHVLTENPNKENLTKALEEGPYGRCVYACDNDVVDHQVVAMEFEGEKTATFTMTAFTDLTDRRTRIFGTRGELSGDGKTIEVFDFLTNKKTKYDTTLKSNVMQGHGGGDFGIMDNFVSAILEENPDKIITGSDETLESHLMVFASERARLNRTVEDIIS